jgi:hypothetical protein
VSHHPQGYIKGAYVGVMNEQFHSIKMHGINNVKMESLLVGCVGL